MEWQIQFSYFLGKKKKINKGFVVCWISIESGNLEVVGSIRELVKYITVFVLHIEYCRSTQKQNTLHDNESSDDCSVSQ